ncbi:Lrp/AsnC family transcriptional regulator [Streptomyces durmitorensis]|uniref:Lrp/AsnC family transcriptional regulator n=1 Tax=Streptomyces durmitorensis TaxID=319947 RepID=A0ABY4PPH2_9ACTN|nr:Lrp/AsnC family transcriptional regulator [Streptomyces durmitorensis]UQT55174.1 Lrp/AsnC family transcriptional regulator [Streptomyces durmitorensis]
MGSAATESPTTAMQNSLDVQLLQALEIDGRAPFSKIAAVLGVSDQTVARRYRRLVADGSLRIVAVRDHEKLGQDQWMLRLRCAPEGADAIATALARRPDTSWIGLTSGGTEVVCCTRPRTRTDQDELLLAKLPRTPHIVDIRAQQMLHRFFGGPDGWLMKHGPLDDEQIAALRPARPAPAVRTDVPQRIEPEDEPLVAALEQDGRATYPELQQATGRSESAVKRRFGALLASGAIYIDIEYANALIDMHVGAMLWITTAPWAMESVGNALASHAEIAHATAVAGPSNIMATAVARDIPALYAYLSGKLGQLDGVQHVETAPFMRRVKQLTYRPYPR